VEPELSSVAERGDQLAVAVQEPPGIDRGGVSDPAIGVEPDGVAFRVLWGGRRLVVTATRRLPS
jgi:hypothetical protein